MAYDLLYFNQIMYFMLDLLVLLVPFREFCIAYHGCIFDQVFVPMLISKSGNFLKELLHGKPVRIVWYLNLNYIFVSNDVCSIKAM